MAGLNQALCGKFKGHFVTAAYVVVDTERQSLLYAGAGHPPLIIMDHSAEEARHFVENGLFLGFFPEATYTAVEIPFKAGDWGVLYTDGILEMTDRSEEQFGLDRFKQFLQDNHDLSADNSSMHFLKSCRDGPVSLPAGNRRTTSRSWLSISGTLPACRLPSSDGGILDLKTACFISADRATKRTSPERWSRIGRTTKTSALWLPLSLLEMWWPETGSNRQRRPFQGRLAS